MFVIGKGMNQVKLENKSRFTQDFSAGLNLNILVKRLKQNKDP